MCLIYWDRLFKSLLTGIPYSYESQEPSVMFLMCRVWFTWAHNNTYCSRFSFDYVWLFDKSKWSENITGKTQRKCLIRCNHLIPFCCWKDAISVIYDWTRSTVFTVFTVSISFARKDCSAESLLCNMMVETERGNALKSPISPQQVSLASFGPCQHPQSLLGGEPM